GVELATIDAHRAAEAAADLEGRLDNGVARQMRHRFEIRDFAGAGCGGPFRSSLLAQVGAQGPQFYADIRQNGPACVCIAWRPRGGLPAPSARHPTEKEKAPRGGTWRFRG